MYDRIQLTITAALGAAATLTVAYPDSRSAEDYIGGTKGRIITNTNRILEQEKGDFTLSFGASGITVTNTSNVVIAAGEKTWLHLDRAEKDARSVTLADPSRMTELALVRINFGKPAAASANAIALSQAATSASGLATGINGALASGGVAVLDKPRNVVAAWTTAAVLTVIGEDEFGRPMRESSASGTSFTGKKAFKKITGITVSANVTGLTVGTGAVLGVPMYLGDAPDVIRELVDSAVPGTAGTILAGDTATATALTGDVRGTYAPNSAPDGARVYELLVATRAGDGKGVPQFAG